MTDKEAIANLNHIYGMVAPDIQRSLDLAIYALEQIAPVMKGSEERPQGEWVGGDKVITHGNLTVSGCWRCNLCGALRGVDANFCGNCGAAMRGENNG